MNKHKSLLLLAWVLVVNAYGQTQLKKWYCGSKAIDMQTTPVVSSSLTGTNNGASNIITDDDGDVLFYCKNTGTVGNYKIEIYGKNNNLLTDFPISSCDAGQNTELPIVPVIENNPCQKRYYLFYKQYYNCDEVLPKEVGLFAKIITYNIGSGTITIENVNRKLNTMGTNMNISNFALAASQSSAGFRFLFFLDNGLKRIDIETYNPTNQGLGSEIILETDPAYIYKSAELDLSPDGTKIAWSPLQSQSQSSDYYIFKTFALPNQGLIAKKTIVFPNSIHRICGVEFSDDNQNLFVTSGARSAIGSGEGVYVLKNGFVNVQYISGTELLGASQLERGYNGNIFVAGANGIAAINQLVPVPILLTPPSTPILSQSVNILSPLGLPLTFFILPDQIDGENYDLSAADDYDVDYFYANNYFNWDGSMNSLSGKTKARIKSGISFQSNGTFFISNMNLELGADAEIVVNSGASLYLTNVQLSSNGCGDDIGWKGIRVEDGGALIINGTKIKDANTAIGLKGLSCALTADNNIFELNKIGITLWDCDPRYIKINGGNVFDGTKFNPKLNTGGWAGIQIYQPNTNFINPFVINPSNTFEGGSYGIKANQVSFLVKGCTFKNFVGTSMAIYSHNSINVTVENCNFTDINRALMAKFNSNITFKNNTVSNTYENAVELSDHHNRIIIIKDNKFTNFRKGAILLHANSGTGNTDANPDANQSTINVSNNIFTNTSAFNDDLKSRQQIHMPTAIAISELGVAAAENFKEVRVNNNTITNVAVGIATSLVAGYQKMDEKYNENYGTIAAPRPRISDIDNNKISIYATYSVAAPQLSDYNLGIKFTNSRGLRGAVNTIVSNRPDKWRNRGFFSENTSQSLFYKNSIAAGRGISGEQAGYGNDINCNNLSGVNGISLVDYAMRNPGSIHGVVGKDSRDNGYGKTIDADIELYLHRNKNLTTLISSNKWLMNQNPQVYIEPAPGTPPFLNYIKATGSAPDFCSNSDLWEPNDPKDRLKFTKPSPTNDTLYDWILEYEFERQQKLEGGVHNGSIRAILEIEEHTASGEYNKAFELLTNINTEHKYERNYATIYEIILQAKLDDDRALDSIEIGVLISFANQNVHKVGTAIYLARVVLWQQLGLSFMDMDIDRLPGINLHLVYTSCFNVLPSEFSLQLLGSNGHLYSPDEVPIILDSLGIAHVEGSIVANLPSNITYTFLLANGAYPSPGYKSLSEWTENVQNNIILCPAVLSKRGDATNQLTNQSLLNNEKAITIAVYPNPTNSNLNVATPQGLNYTIVLYDMTGKQSYIAKQSGNSILNTNTFDAGVYLVKIMGENGDILYNQRILVTK